MKHERKTISLAATAVERVDDLVACLVEDYSEHRLLSRADVVSALIYAAPVEPASLHRLVRLGRMERLEDDGFEGPFNNAIEYGRCERSAMALGWRERPA